GLEDRGARTIAARDAADVAPGRNEPAAIFVGAEQGSKAGFGIEARQTKPVDRPVPRHQRAGEHVADEAIVFDGPAHIVTLRRETTSPASLAAASFSPVTERKRTSS